MSDFLSLDEIRSETLVELPAREMLTLVTIKYVDIAIPVKIVVGDVLTGNNICAQVLANKSAVWCTVK